MRLEKASKGWLGKVLRGNIFGKALPFPQWHERPLEDLGRKCPNFHYNGAAKCLCKRKIKGSWDACYFTEYLCKNQMPWERVFKLQCAPQMWYLLITSPTFYESSYIRRLCLTLYQQKMLLLRATPATTSFLRKGIWVFAFQANHKTITLQHEPSCESRDMRHPASLLAYIQHTPGKLSLWSENKVRYRW